MKIFLDIETVPLGEEPIYQWEHFKGIKAPSNYKDPEKIKQYIEDNQGDAIFKHEQEQDKKALELLTEWKKGALKATRSQIVCICATLEIGNNQFKMASSNENELLFRFSDWLYDMEHAYEFEFVGHNIIFDLQMIRTHAAKFTIATLKRYFTFEKWAKNIHDTMQLWAGVRYDDKTKLTEIAEFLGIKDLNEGTTGADIYDLYKAGKFEEIETKCLNDVIMCKEVYERIS